MCQLFGFNGDQVDCSGSEPQYKKDSFEMIFEKKK